MSRIWIGSAALLVLGLALVVNLGASHSAVAQAAGTAAGENARPADLAAWKSTLTGAVDVYLQPEPVSSLRASLIGVTLDDVRTIGTTTLLTFKEPKGTARWVVNAQHITAIRVNDSK